MTTKRRTKRRAKRKVKGYSKVRVPHLKLKSGVREPHVSYGSSKKHLNTARKSVQGFFKRFPKKLL